MPPNSPNLFDRFVARFLPKPPTPEEIRLGDRLPLGLRRDTVDLAVERLMHLSGRQFVGIRYDRNEKRDEATFVGSKEGESYVPTRIIPASALKEYHTSLKLDQVLFSNISKAGAQLVAVPLKAVEFCSLPYTRQRHGLRFETSTFDDFEAMGSGKDPKMTSPLLDHMKGGKIAMSHVAALSESTIAQFEKSVKALHNPQANQKFAGPMP